MPDEENITEQSDKTFAAVCGLYCRACSWYIAATEEPGRLRRLASQFHFTEEESLCRGCRSSKRLPYCANCKMSICAAERGIDFCSQCDEYPCKDLKSFQSAMPHRFELWSNLDRIWQVGYAQWLREMEKHYSCPSCGTMNSAYDLKCRKCGEEPSCSYVAVHKHEIEQHLKDR
jgi:hypothetical protein